MPIVGESVGTHPTRSFRTRVRAGPVLCESLRLGREDGIPLMQTVARLGYDSARPLGEIGLTAIRGRGRLQEGMVADITIFQPEEVTDNATSREGDAPLDRVPLRPRQWHRRGRELRRAEGRQPGQPIRFEPEPSRFEPIREDKWKHIYTVSGAEFGGTDPFGCGH